MIMGYSTVMYIYNWRSIENIQSVFADICAIFKWGVRYRLNSDFWSRGNKGYTFFDDFIHRQIEQAIDDDLETLFISCKHDGINDIEVDRLFKIYAQLFTRLCDETLVQISDRDSNHYFIDGDHGFMRTILSEQSLADTDHLINLFKKEQAKRLIRKLDKDINAYEQQ